MDLLIEAGYAYMGNGLADDVPHYWVTDFATRRAILTLPYYYHFDDQFFLMFPRKGTGLEHPDALFRNWKAEFDAQYKRGRYFHMTLHPQHIGWCNRLQLLDDFLAYLRGFPGLWNPTGAECAVLAGDLSGERLSAPRTEHLAGLPRQPELMSNDRFGNPHAPNLPYARGRILATTEDDFRKLQRAWALIRERGPESVFIFTGLEHSLPMTGEELRFADDEIATALYFERLRSLALAHLGGSPDQHDVAVFNRMTGATLATHLTLLRPGDVVIGASASYSHPSVLRAASHVGARFVDTAGLNMFEQAIADESRVALVDLTRLAVTYDLMPVAEIRAIVRLAHAKGAVVYMDDAGGARVGPAGFDQPRMLELSVDIGATGLDKFGTIGPRLGLLAGRGPPTC
jgi:hypothetical protein